MDLLHLHNGSPPKRVNTTMSNYAAKNYQDHMDSRLSMPKRKTDRFDRSKERKLTTNSQGSRDSGQHKDFLHKIRKDEITIQPVPLGNLLSRKERPKSVAKNRMKSSWVVA